MLKEGTLNRTKITENGKKLRKNWAPAHVVLTELFLLFFKDAKTFEAMVCVTHSSTVLFDKLVMHVSVLGFAIRSFVALCLMCCLVDSKVEDTCVSFLPFLVLEQKTSPGDSPSGAAQPEFSIDLNGALLEHGEKASSRRNVFLLTTVLGLQVLLQCDSAQQEEEWFKAIHKAIKDLVSKNYV